MVATAMKPCLKCLTGAYIYDPEEQWDKCLTCGDLQYRLWLVVSPPPPPAEEAPTKPKDYHRQSVWSDPSRYTTDEIEIELGYGQYRVRRE